jgi:hypothetical protein
MEKVDFNSTFKKRKFIPKKKTEKVKEEEKVKEVN